MAPNIEMLKCTECTAHQNVREQPLLYGDNFLNQYWNEFNSDIHKPAKTFL